MIACATLVGGCGTEAVSVGALQPGPEARADCRRLVDALPRRVSGQPPRPVAPANSLAGAWGEPPIVLRCGVRRPAQLTFTSRCDEVNGVGWFARRTPDGYVFTTIGRAEYVEVVVPTQYAPEAGALIDLAAAVKQTVPKRSGCV